MYPMQQEMMVKRYICEIPGPHCRFRVYETGNPKFYLFCVIDVYGCDHGLHYPIQKSNLAGWATKWIRANYAKRIRR